MSDYINGGDGHVKLRAHGPAFPGTQGGLNQPISSEKGTLPSKFDAGSIYCIVFFKRPPPPPPPHPSSPRLPLEKDDDAAENNNDGGNHEKSYPR